MNYYDLTIHQKISLKGIIASQKEREDIGIFDHKYFDGLYALSIIDKNFICAINIFLKQWYTQCNLTIKRGVGA